MLYFEDFLEVLSRSKFFRWLFCNTHLIQSKYYLFTNNYYKAVQALCRPLRLFGHDNAKACDKQLHHVLRGNDYSMDIKNTPSNENKVLISFLKSKEAKQIWAEFNSFPLRDRLALRFPKPGQSHDRPGNLVILRPYDSLKKVKGAIYLQYNECLKRLLTVYDISKLAKHYQLILEPSTWGYYLEDFIMLAGVDVDLIIQAQDSIDFNIINRLDLGLVPIPIGAGDWVDHNLFTPTTKNENARKEFDVVMIASWMKIKRHRVLFKALSKTQKVHKVALIGYPWSGRSKDDILKEAKYFKVEHLLTFFEGISPAEVSKVLCNSKVAVMLTRREGANRGVYEALFSNIPVILSSCNRGVNKAIINPYTGVMASDGELASIIDSTIMNYKRFSPRKWALENTGYINSWKKLNSLSKEIEKNNKGLESSDLYRFCNAPNFRYVSEVDGCSIEHYIMDLKNYCRANIN